ncbi:MAG: hypothetical protein EOO38_14280 [Cytophagaceae bacterium]|nr:MAG: hypothetical protein EOO38_14280 [Cytophagaceae bacterium]
MANYQTLRDDWDDSPSDFLNEEDVFTWVSTYRRRLHATSISGRTGRRDRTLLLALSQLMSEQGERIIHTTYPNLVRVSSLTHHTVLSAVKSCRKARFLSVLGYSDIPNMGKQETGRLWRFALVDHGLAPDEGTPYLPTPLSRAAEGNFRHDAFGGRRGIRPTQLALLRWIADHPNCILAEVGASGVASRPTCYRVWGQLVSHGLAHLDPAGYCALSSEAEGVLLGGIVEREQLRGAMERRVQYAIGPEQSMWGRGQAGHWGMPH